ncbi:MAG TPA: chaperone NapD [Azonexus sp.]|nr:chaperone NapD [Azonexus sp.]
MDMQVSTGVNISSVIVGALPAAAEQVAAQLRQLAGVEVHVVADDGRMIVSIVSTSEGAMVSTFEAIRQLPGVLSASLVFHQYESDPDEEA